MTEGKVLGLDWGSKRIGIAISDGARTVALGRETYQREDLEDAVKYVRELASEEGVGLIVLGMPYHMDGGEGELVEAVENFKEALEAEVSIPVETVDERLTSSEAERVMLESDLSREERKRHRDKLAATLILQRYLDKEGS
ncbi:Holliday junction resolvase RuvX [Candidatus Bipolaricaulota bacterium]|nr:Holliday junction resolvase RuvX [Candidatus Bipolaricaulota bacterium]